MFGDHGYEDYSDGDGPDLTDEECEALRQELADSAAADRQQEKERANQEVNMEELDANWALDAERSVAAEEAAAYADDPEPEPDYVIDGEPDYAARFEGHVLSVGGEDIEIPESIADNGEWDRVQVHFPDVENGTYSESHVEAPLGWCNSATIGLDPADNAVHVSISAGDCRGAFALTIRKLPDGSLVMHLPYVGMPAPHMRMTDGGWGRIDLG